MRAAVGAVVALASGGLLGHAAGAAETASPSAATAATSDASAANVPLERFQEPRVKDIDRHDYPNDEIERYGEGWVNLGFMVDPKGKPFESASELKFIYTLEGGVDGAGASFILGYEKLAKAISANDRPAAEAAMGKLKVTNLYEDALWPGAVSLRLEVGNAKSAARGLGESHRE